jgi:cytoskeleton protein RodZ
MTDESIKPDSSPPPAAETIDPIARPGAWLRRERLQQAKTVNEIAAALRLRPYQVEALEADDAAKLPGVTFIRGFIRNYARELGVDSSTLLGAPAAPALLSNEPTTSSARSIEPVSQNIRFDANGEPTTGTSRGVIFGILLLLIAGVAAYWWLVIHPQTSSRAAPTGPQASAPKATEVIAPPSQTVPPTTDSVPVAALSSTQPVAVPTPNNNPQTSAQLAATAAAALAAQRSQSDNPTPSPIVAAASPPPTSAPSSPPSASNSRLQLQFAEDAWLQIRGARGKVVHEKLHTKGSSFEFDGEGKLALTIGNAKNVKLSQKGKSVDLAPHTDVAVARLTLE